MVRLLKKKKHQLNNEEKSNTTVLDYFKYLHYGKRNKHKNFVLEKMNIGHFYQIYSGIFHLNLLFQIATMTFGL